MPSLPNQCRHSDAPSVVLHLHSKGACCKRYLPELNHEI